MIIERMGLVLVLVAGVAGPGVVRAEELQSALSAIGPGTGRGASAFGLGAIYVPKTVGPAISFDYSRGLHEHVDFQLRTQLGFLFPGGGFAAAGVIDPGFLFRLAPRSPSFGIGLRVAPEIFFLGVVGGGGGGGFALFGAAPGLIMSFGGDALRVNLGTDAPMYFAAAGGISGIGGGAATTFLATLRPFSSVEGRLSPGLSLFVRAAPAFVLNEGGGFLFFDGTVGVVF